jgi:hypothetical protein
MSPSRPSSKRNMGISLDPVVSYYDPLMGITPAHLLSNHVAFPSDVNGYQDPSITTEPIGRSTHHRMALLPTPRSTIFHQMDLLVSRLDAMSVPLVRFIEMFRKKIQGRYF